MYFNPPVTSQKRHALPVCSISSPPKQIQNKLYSKASVEEEKECFQLAPPGAFMSGETSGFCSSLCSSDEAFRGSSISGVQQTGTPVWSDSLHHSAKVPRNHQISQSYQSGGSAQRPAPGLSGQVQNPVPDLLRSLLKARCASSKELCEAAGGSGFLGSRGQDHRRGQTVHAQSWDVDLITAVGGKLRRETETDQSGIRIQ